MMWVGSVVRPHHHLVDVGREVRVGAAQGRADLEALGHVNRDVGSALASAAVLLIVEDASSGSVTPNSLTDIALASSSVFWPKSLAKAFDPMARAIAQSAT